MAAPMILESYHLPPVIETAPWVLSDGGALDIDRCPDCWERRAHIERYVFACNVFRNARVLDFGCGVGFGSEMLARAGNTVTGVDPSWQALNLTRQRHQDEFSWERLGFVSQIPTGVDFDGCVALEVIEHLEDPATFIATVPERHLVASVPVRPTTIHNHFHRHDFTIESFRALVETRFVIKSWWLQMEPFHNEPSIMVVHGEARA
jgi:cyclopropane fatty-acyl-phospholipid synthase-like methyltransferase